MIIERDYPAEKIPEKVFLPESDEDAMDDLSEGFKVTYAVNPIDDVSGTKEIIDDLKNDIYYPSGVSVGQEGFDE